LVPARGNAKTVEEIGDPFQHWQRGASGRKKRPQGTFAASRVVRAKGAGRQEAELRDVQRKEDKTRKTPRTLLCRQHVPAGGETSKDLSLACGRVNGLVCVT